MANPYNLNPSVFGKSMYLLGWPESPELHLAILNSPYAVNYDPIKSLKNKTPYVPELDPSTLGIGTLNKYDSRDDIYAGNTNPGSTNGETTGNPTWYKNPNLYADLGVGLAKALAGGNESTVGNLILEGSKFIPDPFLSKLGQIAGAGYNALFGYKENKEFTNSLRTQLKALDNFRSGASTNDTLNALVGRIKGPSWKRGDLGTQGFFNSYIDDLDANFLALREVGELNALNELYWNGLGIALDYNNNLRNYSVNAAYGGPLFSLGGLTWPISGADWTNGVDYIGAGGSHESNPHQGVPVSIADDGLPNLVEEGEVLFNNYVFSKRIKAPKDLVKKYGGGGSLETFADLALKAGEESKERPNDPISRNGLLASMSDLAMRQEEIRLLQLLEERLAAFGGALENLKALGGHLYEGGGPNDKDKKYTGLTDEQRNKIINEILNKSEFGVRQSENALNGLKLQVLMDALGVDHKVNLAPGLAIRDAAAQAADFLPIRYSPLGELLRYEPAINMTNLLNTLNASNVASLRAAINNNPLSAMANLMAINNQAQATAAKIVNEGADANMKQRSSTIAGNNEILKDWSSNSIDAEKANQSTRAAGQDRMGNLLSQASGLDANAYQFALEARDKTKSSLLLSQFNYGKEALLERLNALARAVYGGWAVVDGNITKTR